MAQAPQPLGGAPTTIEPAVGPAPGGGFDVPVPAQTAGGVPVTVNIYTLLDKTATHTRVGNDVLDLLGISIYHAGVEIFGKEYAFGMDPSQRPDPNIDGIFTVEPRQAVGDFKEAVVVGHMPATFTPRELGQIVAELRHTWRAVTYHILDRNCCHFAKAMVVTLNPAFRAAFPDYVCRAAKVGSTVVPEALVRRITEAVNPPPAVPPHLANVIDVPFEGMPPARPPLSSPSSAAPSAQAASPKPSGPAGLFKSVGRAALSVTKTVGGVVGGIVGGLVSESDRRSYQKRFPGCNPGCLQDVYQVSVNYCFREYEAELYIASDCLALCGPAGLSVVIPMTDIAAIHPARYIPPPAPRLPPTFELTPYRPDSQCPAFFIFRRSRPGTATPIFQARTTTSGLSEKVNTLAGTGGHTATDKAFDLVERLWAASQGMR
jgi:hypothetical protein